MFAASYQCEPCWSPQLHFIKSPCVGNDGAFRDTVDGGVFFLLTHWGRGETVSISLLWLRLQLYLDILPACLSERVSERSTLLCNCGLCVVLLRLLMRLNLKPLSYSNQTEESPTEPDWTGPADWALWLPLVSENRSTDILITKKNKQKKTHQAFRPE